MADDTKSATFQIRANVPPEDSKLQFNSVTELLVFLQETLFVANVSGAVDGQLSFGSSDPAGEENRATSLHVLRDASDKPIGFRVWSRGKYVDLFRNVLNQVALYPMGAAPDGWLLADGDNGTINLSDATPHETLAYYQFKGF